MEKLAGAIREAILPGDEPMDSGPYEFRLVAIDWARHSLSTYTGDLLQKALNISIALVHFINEMEQR